MTETITVRYFAGAKAAVGVEQEQLSVDHPRSLGELVDRLAEQHGPALGRILAACSFLIDEISSTREQVVTAGSVVDVLPPFAGG